MTQKSLKPSRRQFLKLAGATTALAVPALLGYDLMLTAEGELPPNLSPYVPTAQKGDYSLDLLAASPILLIMNDQTDNPFGAYLSEILRAEGINCFQTVLLSTVDSNILERFDIVLLAEGQVNNNQADLLKNYVAKGGRLVAMRPAEQLASLFGLERAAGNSTEGYLQVNPDHVASQGISPETLQFHGTADHYYLAGAQAIAWLATDTQTKTDFPAVTIHHHEQGWAALWAFDLARSVAYTRQGNPALANVAAEEWNGIRACNMFKDWLDLDRITIPQADEQQRLLVNLVSLLSQEVRPLPRLWYFPGAAAGMFVATSDWHANPHYGAADLMKLVEQRQGHVTFYYTPTPGSDWRRANKRAAFFLASIPGLGDSVDNLIDAPSPSMVADLRARGHKFALHPYVDEYSIEPGLEKGWHRYWREFTGYGYGPVPPTARTHRVIWTGWVESARVQASYGIRMNMDYYHWGPLFRSKAGDWLWGHFTGSGRPMRFVDEQGRMLNIYQQLTQLADDHWLNLHWGGVAKLSAEACVEISKLMLDNSLANFCVTAANLHVDPFTAGEQWRNEAARWVEGTLDYAVELGIPIWSTEAWLDFTEARHDVDFKEIEWNPTGKRLSFQMTSSATSGVELAVMIPLNHGKAKLAQVEVDGKLLKLGERTVGGVTYGWVSVPPKTHQIVATYA